MKISKNYLFLLLLSLAACKKNGSVAPAPESSKMAPDGFNFATSRAVDLNIRFLTNNNEPLKGVVVSFYSPSDLKDNAFIYKAVTDNNGYVSGTLNLPSYLDRIVVKPNYVGLISDATAVIANNAIVGVIGGKEGFSGNIQKTASAPPFTGKRSFGTLGTIFSYMGSYTSSGAPLNYLEPVPDVISPSLLSFINTSLPEKEDVRLRHANYVADGAASSLNVVKRADVWITFISEGAGNLNAVGFYTYPTNSPPQSVNDIAEIKYLYPNASLSGSGGGMNPGDKIKLGRFEAGTSIGFVLFRNGWVESTHTVENGVQRYFSNSNLNPESSAELKRHMVLLSYPAQHVYMIGFEDINRSEPDCDQDFNDVTMYATANPVDAFSDTDVEPLDSPTDTDGDGVNDVNDEYPNDRERAYNYYFPSRSGYATLAFEDKWPSKGDYDMNDLVVNYQYKFVGNAQNKLVEFTGNFAPVASGASYINGFGVRLPISASSVSQVTGQRLTQSYISLSANGTERGQTEAVIIPFDNQKSLIADGVPFVNTLMERGKVRGDTAKVYVKFTSPISNTLLNTAAFDPFLIASLRSVEVHLPGFPPTQKADKSLLGIDDDNSNEATGRYYLSSSNQPWALSFNETFQYPIEFVDIQKGYLKFAAWAASGGTNFVDWYTNTGSGYRNGSLIYTK